MNVGTDKVIIKELNPDNYVHATAELGDTVAHDASVQDQVVARRSKRITAPRRVLTPEGDLDKRFNETDFEASPRADKSVHEMYLLSEKTSERWFGAMANGSKQIAKVAGGLWSALTKSNRDPAFAPESLLVQGAKAAKDVFWDNPKAMATGKKKFKQELEPGVWVNTDQLSLLEILQQDLSVSRLGSALKTGVSTIVGGLGTRLRRNTVHAQETQAILENFTPPASSAEASVGALEILNNLSEAAGLGAREGVVQEVWEQRGELAKTTKYVLGGGFLAEVYAGLRDKVTDKQGQAIEAVLNGPAVETLAVKPPAPVFDKLEPSKSGVKNKLFTALREATLGLHEIVKFHGGGVVDLGHGYADMFHWLAEQNRRFEAQFKEGSLNNQRQELLRQASEAGGQRLDVAATESAAIAGEAVQAKLTLAETVTNTRETFVKLIDKTEAGLVRRHRLLNKSTLDQHSREEIKNNMAYLERQLDKYELAIAAIDKLYGLEAEIAEHSIAA